jgi:hypothetical protein
VVFDLKLQVWTFKLKLKLGSCGCECGSKFMLDVGCNLDVSMPQLGCRRADMLGCMPAPACRLFGDATADAGLVSIAHI